jgi:hypothetical protein
MSGTVSVPTMSMEMEQVLKLWRVEESDSEFSIFDFDQIADATDNFSDDHKLGQGGFGPVYKVLGVLSEMPCFSSRHAESPSINWHTRLLCHVLTLSLSVHHQSG